MPRCPRPPPTVVAATSPKPTSNSPCCANAAASRSRTACYWRSAEAVELADERLLVAHEPVIRATAARRQGLPRFCHWDTINLLAPLNATPRTAGGELRAVSPIRGVIVKVVADRSFDGREEATLAKLRHEPEAPDLVFYGVLKFRKAELDVSSLQGLVQFGQGIGRGDIDAGDRLRGNDQPPHRGRRILCGRKNAFL